MNCQPLLLRRRACYEKHRLPKDRLLQEKSQSHALRSSHPCLATTLHAKRCLAFHHCEMEALHYYGTPNDTLGPKALCASFDEAYCFGNPGRMKVDSDAIAEKERIFLHHQNAKRRIVNNRNKFRACQEISDRIHQCLRTANVDVDSISTSMDIWYYYMCTMGQEHPLQYPGTNMYMARDTVYRYVVLSVKVPYDRFCRTSTTPTGRIIPPWHEIGIIRPSRSGVCWVSSWPFLVIEQLWTGKYGINFENKPSTQSNKVFLQLASPSVTMFTNLTHSPPVTWPIPNDGCSHNQPKRVNFSRASTFQWCLDCISEASVLRLIHPDFVRKGKEFVSGDTREQMDLVVMLFFGWISVVLKR